MPKKVDAPKLSGVEAERLESDPAKLDEIRMFLGQAVQPPLPPKDIDKYTTILNGHGVDVATLCMLEREDLKELGITNLVHTAWIYKAVERTKSGQWRRSAPKPAKGGPVVVHVKVGMQQLRVDSVGGLATVKFFFDMFWYDRRLVGSPCGEISEFAWRPDAFVLNHAGEMNKELLNDPPVLVDSETGKVLCAIHFHGQVDNSQRGLKSFPYDHDDVVIDMMQMECNNSEEFVFRPSDPAAQSVSLQGDFCECLFEWVLRGFSVHGQETKGGNGVTYSHYAVAFHLRRLRFYYIYKVVFPMFMATVYCFASFYFETGDLANRIAVSMTMFLATAALLLVLDSSLPKTDYLTMIDKYTLVSIGIQAATSLLACVMSKMHELDGDHEELADTLNIIGAISLAGVYFIVTLVTFGPYEWMLWRQKPGDRPAYLDPNIEFYLPYALPTPGDQKLAKANQSLETPSIPLIGKVDSLASE